MKVIIRGFFDIHRQFLKEMEWIMKGEKKMLVSIITVSHNSETTIKRTLESVYMQSYHQIEYIIIDGASTDRTMQIVEEYNQKFHEKGISYYYLSEPDGGIYDAMNKGIRMASGELIGIINSDDWYEPCAVMCAAENYKKQEYDLFYGDLRIVGDKKSFIKKAYNRNWITSRYWNHPTTFIPARIYRKYLYKTETIHDDWDLILRIRKDGARVCVENTVLANFTRKGVSHERTFQKALERAKIKYRIYRENGYSRLYAVECYGVEMAKLVL